MPPPVVGSTVVDNRKKFEGAIRFRPNGRWAISPRLKHFETAAMNSSTASAFTSACSKTQRAVAEAAAAKCNAAKLEPGVKWSVLEKDGKFYVVAFIGRDLYDGL